MRPVPTAGDPGGWVSLADRRPLASLAAAVLACEAAGAAGSVATSAGVRTWYPSVTKPALTPPDWVFAPVWITLFALMGVAAWLIWRRAPEDPPAARLALGVFGAHLLVNVAWSFAFFGLRSPLAGLVVILALVLAILVTALLFSRIDPRAGALLVPYLAWVGFAVYLNAAIYALN